MSSRGTYKYICDECQAENWLTAKERSSRFKPRCIECGSTWLEPSRGSKGPEELSNHATVAKDLTAIRNKKMGKIK